MTEAYTPDWTKTGDVFVEADGTELRNPVYCEEEPHPWKLMQEHGPEWFDETGGSVLCDEKYRIIRQYTPTTAPVDVPQWLYDASTEVSARRMGVLPEYVLEIIARHAPRAEAGEVPSTGGGFRTSKAFTAQAWEDHGEPALPAPQPGAASGVEVMQGTVSNARAFNRALTQTEIDNLHADPNAWIEGEVPVKVGGVERIRMWDDESAATYTEVVTAADHDRIVREKDADIKTAHELIDIRRKQIKERDAEIAELRRQVNTMQASCDMNINAASVAEELLEHERQTHKELGEIVGTDDSLAECCKRLRTRAEAAEKERDGWHGVVVECEKILKAVGTAEKPLTSNLPNLIRDRLLNLHRAEERAEAAEVEVARLRETRSIEVRLKHVADESTGDVRLVQLPSYDSLTAQLAAANERVAALRDENERLEKSLVDVCEALRLFPLSTVGGGNCGSQYSYTIDNGTIWHADLVLKKIAALAAGGGGK